MQGCVSHLVRRLQVSLCFRLMGLGEILEGHASTAMIAIHSVISSLAAAQLLLVNITTNACTITISKFGTWVVLFMAITLRFGV